MTGEQLILRIGPHSRRIPLATAAAARPIPSARGEKRAFWMKFVPSFVSEAVPTRVELILADGKTFAFSSRNPDHLAEMIASAAARLLPQSSARAGAPASGSSP